MIYSFVQPKKKPLLNLFMKIWLALTGLSSAFIIMMCLFYLIKIGLIDRNMQQREQQIAFLEEKIFQTNDLYEILLDRKLTASQFKTQNNTLKEGLRNFFDMIVKSDSIKLESFEWDKNTLKLNGISPTKEMFILLVETPLKSIFDETYTSYYKLSNGWYRFVNINKQNLGERNER